MALRTIGTAVGRLASRRPCPASAPAVVGGLTRSVHQTASVADGVHPLGQVCMSLGFSFTIQEYHSHNVRQQQLHDNRVSMPTALGVC